MSDPLGFIGLGKMGRPMVRRLLNAGFQVHIWNRSPEAVLVLAGDGATVAGSAAEVAERAAVVMTALPTLESVSEVYRQLCAKARPGQLYIDHSTVNPDLGRACAQKLASKGAEFLDAPVSGGPAGAETGTLTVMVGGSQNAFERAMPVLRAFGENIKLCGPVGSGDAVKLVNQLLVAVHTLASAEATLFGERLGVGPELLADTLGTSFGASRMLTRNLPRFASQDYSPATPIDLILKDLRIIETEAERTRLELRLGRRALDAFTEAAGAGLGGLDMAGLLKHLQPSGPLAIRPG